jgi:hypothetical protein
MPFKSLEKKNQIMMPISEKAAQYSRIISALFFYKTLTESNIYNIEKQNTFASWLDLGVDFDVSNVRDSIHAMFRLNDSLDNEVNRDIFHTIQTSLNELADTSMAQTAEIRKMIWIIKDIPSNTLMDNVIEEYVKYSK